MIIKLKDKKRDVIFFTKQTPVKVNGCLRKGRTLNQTIRDARESQAAKSNPYLDDEDLIENKYYQFKGAE